MPSPTAPAADRNAWVCVHHRATAAVVDTDFRLLERWREGDGEAGSELLARHFNTLRVYFLARVPHRQIEDLIQEVFLRMVEALERFEGRSSVRTYLLRIARNVVLETYRAKGNFDEFHDSQYALGGRNFASLCVENDERLQLLLDAMQQIPLRQQDLLECHYFHGLSMAELAELFELKVGTVKSRMSSARRALLQAFVALLGEDSSDWSDAILEERLERAREAVLKGKRRD